MATFSLLHGRIQGAFQTPALFQSRGDGLAFQIMMLCLLSNRVVATLIGCGQCFFITPAKRFDALINTQSWKTSFSRPIGQIMRLAIQCQFARIAFVCGLSAHRGPSAILFRVGTVVVNAFNRESLWAWSHVFQEGGERRLPFLRHYNSTTAVIGKLCRIGLKTAFTNTAPRFVFGSAHATMFEVILCTEASATLRQSPHHLCGANRNDHATGALEQPSRVRHLASRIFSECSQAVKNHSGFKFVHGLILPQGQC